MDQATNPTIWGAQMEGMKWLLSHHPKSASCITWNPVEIPWFRINVDKIFRNLLKPTFTKDLEAGKKYRCDELFEWIF